MDRSPAPSWDLSLDRSHALMGASVWLAAARVGGASEGVCVCDTRGKCEHIKNKLVCFQATILPKLGQHLFRG